MKSWEIKTLGELNKNKDAIVSGPFGSNLKVSDYKNQGIPILRLQNIGKGYFIDKDIKYITNEKAKELKYHSFVSGDIALAKLGIPVGKTCIIPENFPKGIVVADVVRIRPDKNIVDYKFLEYYLNTDLSVAQLTGNITGATRPRVNLSDVRNIKLYLPSMSEQQLIVSILDRAFITINQAKENLQRNLQNARELFQAELNSLDLKKEKLETIVNIVTGKLNSNEMVENGKYPFFTCSRDIYKIDKYAFDTEAILLAGNNASGDFNVKHYKGKFNAYQRTYVITAKDEMKIDYRYLYYQMEKSLVSLKRQSVGAATKFLKLPMIQNFEIDCPSIEQQKKIVNQLDTLSIETKYLENMYKKKLDNLEELKKSILQKAFNGELTIKQPVLV
jgi:type I restriction enzyme, S subunit